MQPACASGPCLIDTGDTRVSGEAIYASGSLYAALGTNGTGDGAGASHFLWFQIRPVLNDNDPQCAGNFLNQCPQIVSASILNEVCWACATGQGDNGTGATFYPEVQPDPEGNVLVVFNYSEDATFPSSAYATNRATEALGVMHDSGFFLQNGLAMYQILDTNGINRWGDEQYVVVSDNHWRCSVFDRGDEVQRHGRIHHRKFDRPARIDSAHQSSKNVGRFFGALAFSLFASVGLFRLMPGHLPLLNWTHAIVLGLLLGFAAVIGYLAESIIKRSTGVKDSGNMLPGIGGALDLVDSLLFTAPLLFFYLRLIVHVP